MKLDFDTDNGIGTRANLGVIVLQADETLENEFRQMIPDRDTALYVSRIPMVPDITPETLARMHADIPSSAKLFPALEFDAIGFGCTSASAVIGPAQITAAVRQVCRAAQVTNPLSAIIAAARALDARRIAFITPYIADVSAQMRDALRQAGIEISSFASFEEGDDRVVARIAPASILNAIQCFAEHSACDAVVVSCTNLRTIDIIAEAEEKVGVPVITSNQALAWDMLRLAGVPPLRPNLGRLFTLSNDHLAKVSLEGCVENMGSL